MQGGIRGNLADLRPRNKPGALHVSHQFYQ